MSSSKPKVAKLNLQPTNLSTGFGSATYNPKTGDVGYTLDDQLAAMRDVFYGAAGDYGTNAAQIAQFGQGVTNYGQGLFNQAANLDTNQMAQDYYNKQQALLQPGRAQEDVRLGDTLFKSGRTGVGVGMGEGYVNPEIYAQQIAREQANAQMGLASEDRARNIQQTDLANAFKYMDSGNALQMQPYQTMAGLFGLGTGIEGLGYQQLGAMQPYSQIQMGADQAMQANQQAINNAKASGGFMSGLGGGLLSAGLNYATGGLSGMATGAMGGGGLFGGIANGIGGGSFGNMGSMFGSWTPSWLNGGVSQSAGAYGINQNPYLNYGV